jgi:hypothetical protein
MKFFLVTFLIAMLVALAMAATADQKPIVVSYPEGTPYSELEELKAAIEKVVSQMQDVACVV